MAGRTERLILTLGTMEISYYVESMLKAIFSYSSLECLNTITIAFYRLYERLLR